MAYKALYRKYRPSNFDEVVGQTHVVKTLQNAIKNDKLAHAYLFCGPRGTGKTSIAKLLAKTINCTGEGYKPCCKCDNCLEIQEGSHPDIVELDAATNNGVDEVRELIEKVKYAPLKAKYKVYIIDEVHMMTSSAFNALLKTLEEPPEYCIFILATTEPYKILPTIISRCQRFDFMKIDAKVIAGHLGNIAEKENVACDQDALKLIAELADGGMRDALSILDQCIAYSPEKITVEDVSTVYGVTTIAEKMHIFTCIKEKNVTELMNQLNKISSRGADIKRLTTELIDIAKETVIYSYSHNADLLEHISDIQAKELLNNFSTDEMLENIDYLMEAQSRYQSAVNSLSYFEVALLKMMSDHKGAQTVVQQMQQQPAPENIEEKPVPKVERPASHHTIHNYSDEELYQILLTANKEYKKNDNEKLTAMSNDDSAEFLALANLIKGSIIYASSENDIILTVKSRAFANNINDEENKDKYLQLTEKYLGKGKRVVAITEELQSHITTYFRSQRELKKEIAPEISKETAAPADDVIQKMNELFGKDGYTIEKN